MIIAYSRTLAGSGFPMSNIALWVKTPIAGASDGDLISTWPDASGFGRDFTASSTARPTYKSSSLTINGLHTLFFDGTSDELVNSNAWNTIMSGWTSGSLFVVGQQTSDPPANGGNWIVNNGSDATGVVPYLDGNVYDSTFTTVRKNVGNLTDSFANPFYYSVISSSGSWKARMNGVQVFSTATNTFDKSNSNDIYLGNSAGSFRYAGQFAEFILYSTALSDADRDAVEAYLAAKYAI